MDSLLLKTRSERQQRAYSDNPYDINKIQTSAENRKLSHPTDCNIVGEAKLPLSLIFLLIVDRIKVKTCVMFQYSTKRKKYQIFSIWHFHIFSYNKI